MLGSLRVLLSASVPALPLLDRDAQSYGPICLRKSALPRTQTEALIPNISGGRATSLLARSESKQTRLVIFLKAKRHIGTRLVHNQFIKRSVLN